MFMIKKSRHSAFLCLLLAAAMLMTGCALFRKKVEISYFDTDGKLIESSSYASDFDPEKRPLPADTDRWHYTGWSVTQAGQVTVCTAKRVAKTRVVWKDHDGTVLKEAFFVEGEEEKPDFDLPEDSEKWVYTDWSKNAGKGEQVYTAVREPNREYFVGNVFQIVIKDRNGETLGTGSGFVLNADGWFITNDHVMEKGKTASAFFDIKDPDGGRYTELAILGGAFRSEKKDLFIGKLAGYDKIKSHYKEIEFCKEYEEGEVCYSVGYPNASVKMTVNEGSIEEEYSDIHSKIDGLYYILSNSYIAPGSSGGILVNENFEVIGITSLGLYDDGEYTSGGSIPYELFQSHLKSYKDSDVKALTELYQ